MTSKKIKSSADAQAGVVVASDTVRMHGKEENYVLADDRGITISGPVSFVDGLEHIRSGALFVFNSSMQLSIPSTTATPQAVLKIDPPVASFEKIAKDVAVMIGLFAGGVF